MAYFRINTEMVIIREYIVEAESEEEASKYGGHRESWNEGKPELSPIQTYRDPQVIMSITPCDESGFDLP